MSTEHDDSTAAPRPGSFASLEIRVARLEKQYDEQAKTVNGMAIDVAVSRAKLESMETNINGLANTVSKAMDVIQQSITDSTTTPAGRAIQATITERHKESDEVHKDLRDSIASLKNETMATRLTVARWAGALAVIVVIINLFAPVILRSVGFTFMP